MKMQPKRDAASGAAAEDGADASPEPASMEKDVSLAPSSPPANAARMPDSPKRIRAAEMLGPRGIVQIEHEGEVYTLRLTRNNRLILTK